MAKNIILMPSPPKQDDERVGQRVQHEPEECNNKYTGTQESPSTTMLQPNSNLQPCSNRMQI